MVSCDPFATETVTSVELFALTCIVAQLVPKTCAYPVYRAGQRIICWDLQDITDIGAGGVWLRLLCDQVLRIIYLGAAK